MTVSVYVPLGVPVVVVAELPPKHAARLTASNAVIATLCASCAPRSQLRANAAVHSITSISATTNILTGSGASGGRRVGGAGFAEDALVPAVVVTFT